MNNINDGKYALGGLVSLNLIDTGLEGRFISKSYSLKKIRDKIYLNPTKEKNFSGHYRLFIKELESDMTFTFDARIALSLDLKNMRVNLSKANILSINTHETDFYADFVGKILVSQEIRDMISGRITTDLQERIINQTLFNDVL